MNERLKRIRQENPDFDKKFVDKFAERMPDLLNIMLDGEEYDCHIGTKEVAMLAEQFITDNKDRKIGFHWTYDEVISTIKNFNNLDDAEFYPCDIFVWANVKYGDMSHITSDAGTILKYAISELTDSDFPFYPASQRAYHWLKRHIENEA